MCCIKKLNRVNTSLLAPSLLFSKVAFSLSPGAWAEHVSLLFGILNASTDKLRELWIIPVIFTITTVVSMLIACLFATILRLKKSQRQVYRLFHLACWIDLTAMV